MNGVINPYDEVIDNGSGLIINDKSEQVIDTRLADSTSSKLQHEYEKAE